MAPGRFVLDAEGRRDSSLFFFFQAEDGIRDYKVTGVQTCALPISTRRTARSVASASSPRRAGTGSRAAGTAHHRWCRAGSARSRSWDRTAPRRGTPDRKSTRLNSSHLVISYAVFCLKKKKMRLTRSLVQTHTHIRFFGDSQQATLHNLSHLS